MSQLEEGPSVMQVGGPLRRKSDDPILGQLMQSYNELLRQAGIPDVVPGEKRPPLPDHITNEEMSDLLVKMDALLDRYAIRCADLIEMGLMELPRRNNNPFYIAKTWIKQWILGCKPGVTERIWRELNSRVAEHNSPTQ